MKEDPFVKLQRGTLNRCYLCGKLPEETPEGQLTSDHLPPQNLFAAPRPSNLITAPCCFACNNGAHNDDEYFRIAVTCHYNSNQKGKNIWKDNVVAKTVRKRRIRLQVEALGASLRKIGLITPQGLQDAFEGELQKAPIDRVLVRMTKGFLSLLYPEIDHAVLSFDVFQFDPFKVNHPLFANVRKHLRYFERGSGVYRCWYLVDTNYSWKGLWTHMFFDSAWFLVEQTSDRRIEMPW